ncbi:hypothetical protein PIB30_063174 [Stylosanthes scabra]|uniref:Uncharacterized protein n=1 Tax=Stylosanthes scabra TaxID=79078 RepID=A0ABU6ZK41_9FABA|nr:hypothetical protein [Stylosanthes scabra]
MVIEAHELRYYRCQLLVIWRLEWTNGVENGEYMCLDARWRDEYPASRFDPFDCRRQNFLSKRNRLGIDSKPPETYGPAPSHKESILSIP